MAPKFVLKLSKSLESLFLAIKVLKRGSRGKNVEKDHKKKRKSNNNNNRRRSGLDWRRHVIGGFKEPTYTSTCKTAFSSTDRVNGFFLPSLAFF